LTKKIKLTEIEDYDYKQLLKLVVSVLAKEDKDIKEFSMNVFSDIIVDLDYLGKSYLDKDNYEWIREYMTKKGKAIFIKELDTLSQLVAKLREKKKSKKQNEKLEDVFNEIA